MITTLEQLDSYTKTSKYQYKKVFKEIENFVIIFLIVGFIATLFTNQSLFANSFEEIFKTQNNVIQQEYNKNNIAEKNSLLTGYNKKNKNLELKITQTFIKKDITAIDIQESNLRKKLNSYEFGFNTLPPTNRLIIPKVGKDIPLVVPNFNKPVNQINKEDFDKALYKGVVKYPTTATPGKKGNTLIFGHTSYESWKNNKYATVFQSLGKINIGDNIQIVWEGKLYNYKIIEKKIISPRHLNEEYMKYTKTKKNYLTLVGCYPFGSDKDRIIVVSKLIN